MLGTVLQSSPSPAGQEESDDVVDLLKSCWIATESKTRGFQQQIAGYAHSPATLALNDGTVGLSSNTSTAFRIGSGDEVITAPLTSLASVYLIEHVGARPLLAFGKPASLKYDPERMRRRSPLGDWIPFALPSTIVDYPLSSRQFG